MVFCCIIIIFLSFFNLFCGLYRLYNKLFLQLFSFHNILMTCICYKFYLRLGLYLYILINEMIWAICTWMVKPFC
ncbi:hypothetical protein Hanom_Chr03g00260471 [Helianthus anomalus]